MSSDKEKQCAFNCFLNFAGTSGRTDVRMHVHWTLCRGNVEVWSLSTTMMEAWNVSGLSSVH